MKKLFGELNISWKRLIIFSIFIGIYTGLVAIVPFTRDTSFRDISITFEWWVLFGTLIIVNSKTPKESAIKCFIFFLISQPLVYLVQVPFNPYGWGIFRYYPGWFKWTLLTIPMGFIGNYLKKDKWWGLFILVPVMAFLGYHYMGFLSEAFTFFPNHLLSALFCSFCIIIFPLYIFKNKKVKTIGLICGILIILAATILAFASGKNYYNTTIIISGGSSGLVFDNTYTVRLEDEDYGKVFIVYEDNIEDYMVNAEFHKTGKTKVYLTSPDGVEYIYDIEIKRDSYDIERKN